MDHHQVYDANLEEAFEHRNAQFNSKNNNPPVVIEPGLPAALAVAVPVPLSSAPMDTEMSSSLIGTKDPKYLDY